MPLVNDLVVRLTNPGLSSGLSGTSTPANSRGGYVSTTLLNLETLSQNLFADVTDIQRRDGYTDYRCIAIHNTSDTESATGLVAWIETQPSITAIAIGLDPAGASADDSSSAQGTTSDGTTAPSGVSFSSPSTEGTGLSVATLAAGQVAFLWVRRTVTGVSSGSSGTDTWRIDIRIPA